MQSSLVNLQHLGSRTGRTFDAVGYGPQRITFKVKGGAKNHLSEEAPSQVDTEAPGSPTSEQLLGKPAFSGTSAVRALARVLNMEVDDSLLTFEQQTLFDLCRKDLNRSCNSYAAQATVHQGQQLLVDLKRMQNIVHRHLSLPGDGDSDAANIYVISQGLTSILRNNKNLSIR